jgi:hypothetical protein
MGRCETLSSKISLFILGALTGLLLSYPINHQKPCVFTESFYYDEPLPGNSSGYILPERIDYHVYFYKSLLDNLSGSYVNETEEKVFCLHGWRKDNVFYIANMTSAYTYSNTTMNLVFDANSCNGSMGTLHTHTHGKNKCIPSFTDIYSWGYLHNQVQVIQCGPKEFTVIKMPGGSDQFEMSAVPWDIYTLT